MVKIEFTALAFSVYVHVPMDQLKQLFQEEFTHELE